jgi:hypothetical protein
LAEGRAYLDKVGLSETPPVVATLIISQ